MQFEIGAIVDGKVTGITKFGAFVDIGEGKSGMVHISEVSTDYVEDIKSHLKVNDQVKVKILTVGEDGKIALSIRKAMPKPVKKPFAKRQPPKPDNSVVWSAPKNEGQSFEEMMAKFKQSSDDRFSDLKRKNPDIRRHK